MYGIDENPETGVITEVCKWCTFEVFTWKIYNVSLIPDEVDYVVESPIFSYYGANWMLKLYPYGQSKCQTEGYIDVVIKMLQPGDGENYYHITIQLFCENIFGKQDNSKGGEYHFDEKYPEVKVCRILKNLKESKEKWKFAPNDALTLIFRFATCHYPVPDFHLKSDKTSIGKKYTENGQIICELFQDSPTWRTFVWRMYKGIYPNNYAFPKDYKIQSPPFSLASASWSLKLCPYYRGNHSNKPSGYVMLKRLDSKIQEHHVIFKINLFGQVAEQSLFFNSHCTEKDVMHFHWEENNVPELDGTYNVIEMHIENNVGLGLNSYTKHLVDLAADKTSESTIPLQNHLFLCNFKELYLKQEDCDAIIKVKGKEFPAHKLILKAQSPVFAATFQNDMKEKATGIVDVEDCDPSTFSDFLCFLYCGELEGLSKSSVFSLFYTADKYDVSGLRIKCMEFIKQNLSVDTFCDTITLALQHSEEELIKISTDFFAKNLKEIIVTVKWQSFVIKNPIQSNELMIKALVTSEK